jgi:hypothetical protein
MEVVPMRSFKHVLAFGLTLLVGLSSPAFAQRQQHVVDPGMLAAAVAQHAAAESADRAAVRDALARRDVRDAAASMGLDPGRLAASVETMSGADLERAASLARQIDQPLVGGASTIVISTTTIIIALLLIILIVLIAD